MFLLNLLYLVTKVFAITVKTPLCRFSNPKRLRYSCIILKRIMDMRSQHHLTSKFTLYHQIKQTRSVILFASTVESFICHLASFEIFAIGLSDPTDSSMRFNSLLVFVVISRIYRNIIKGDEMKNEITLFHTMGLNRVLFWTHLIFYDHIYGLVWI